MTTRRQFIQSVPAAGAAFAVAGHIVLDDSPARAQGAAPLKGHFHAKGKAPSEHTLRVLAEAKKNLPFSDTRDFDEQKKGLIAEMVSLTEGARLLVRRGAWLNDQDRPFTREIAIAKYFEGEAVVRAAGMAMEIHGGMGYSLEMPVERYYRDSKLYQVGEGTANIMRLLIADDALGIKNANRPRVKVPSDFRDLE